MKNEIPYFKSVKKEILVIGDIILDRYWNGITKRISPESPVPVVKVNSIQNNAGGAANVAISIQSLGIKARLISVVGIDEEAETLKKILEENKISNHLISIKNYLTITKLRIISQFQQLLRIDFEKKIEENYGEIINKYIKKSLSNTGLIVLSDYSKGTLIDIKQIIKYAKSAKIPVLIDPKGNDFSKYRGATLLTPNLSEFQSVIRKTCKNEKDIIKYGMEIIFENDLQALVITRSENGITLLQKNKKPLYFPTKVYDVFDVTGAGDTVLGVLAASIASGESLEQSCFIANIAAGISVGKFGNSIVQSDEIKKSIFDYIHHKDYGIINEIRLILIINRLKKCNQKVVMITGYFDILDFNNINYLINAKELGNRLIVAVKNDFSNKIKNSLENRMFVLSSLKLVDWIISYTKETIIRLVKNISPDFLVKIKNETKSIEEIQSHKEVLKYGGIVKNLN